MTKRSVFLGLLVALALGSLCYFNDGVIRQGRMINSLMPVLGYGGLVLVAFFCQPALRLFGERFEFGGRELAVVFAFFLLAAGIPGIGLVQYLPTAVMMPHHDARVRPGWAAEDVVSIAPERMLADVSKDEDRALDGYVTGLSVGDQHISVSDVPWDAWKRTLAFWTPLLLCILLAMLGLAAVFHTQWAHHEQLPYPITTFTKALLPDGRGLPAVFRNRLFWWGFGVVFAIGFNNYMLRWFPETLIRVSLSYDFSAFQNLAPILIKGAGNGLFHPRIWFTVMALAYFLPSDISFSMGTVPFLYACVYGFCASRGIPFRCGRMLGPSIEQSVYAGGYAAIVLMMLYTGRHFYWNVLKRSVGMRSGERTERHAVWGLRLFLLCTSLFIAQLVAVGLDWQLAIVYTALVLMVHVVISRMIVETGGFFIGTYVYPGVMIWTVLGASALGPRTMLIMFLVSTVLVSGPGWAPMPFFVQAFGLADRSQVRVGRMLSWGMAVVVLVLLVAIPCTVYWQYDRGAPTRGWVRATSWYSFENMVEIRQRLRGQERLEQAESVRGWQRVKHMAPLWPQMTAFGIALSIALTVGACRLRFPWWPLHPLAFVFLGGYPAYYHWFSFLLGWIIKQMVTRYGGGQMYQTLKPLMIGVIAGTMVGKLVPMIVGTILYLVTGSAR